MGALELTSLGVTTIVVGWTFITLALLSILLQFWARRRSLQLHDHSLNTSFALSFVLMILTTWAVATQGQGQHMSTESRSQLENAAKSLLTNEILWGVVNTFMRLGTIGFLRRIFLVGSSFSLTMIFCIIGSIAYGVVVIVTPLAICAPIRASWDRSISGRCGNQKAAFLGLEIGGLLLDLAITVWPLPKIYNLQISLGKRVGLLFVFSLGSLVFIITGLRIAALDKVNSEDFTYNEGYIGLLSIVGPLIAIICCSAPVVPGLVHRARNRVQKVFPTRRTLYLIRATRDTITRPWSRPAPSQAPYLTKMESIVTSPNPSSVAMGYENGTRWSWIDLNEAPFSSSAFLDEVQRMPMPSTESDRAH
ncbi:hypothetical protein BJ166DRAFT_543940 [Pestalotiopsis sp. NC0098]|nr:hypothetical protein BJ166DRAFT_543940 [Pestalotiopsis sp. NC0098]